MATINIYLINCIRPLNGDELKTIYFDNKNPVGKLIINAIHKAAVYGSKAIKPRLRICL